MKPLDPRLTKSARATAGYLILVVALAILATGSTVAIAWNLASFVVEIFVNQKQFASQLQLLSFAALGALLRALAHFLQEWFGFLAAGSVKQELRNKALVKLASDGSGTVSKTGSGELSQLLGPSLDSLDVYFSKYLPQLVFTALVTPALTLLIWLLDSASGITVLLTLPLIPLFMVMIGYVTRDLQSQQLQALERLNGHFLEIIKGLVTLKIFNRTKRQEAILGDVSEQYRQRTMKVLRLSFLSGFALELAASLSVALIAVSIGIRLVDGQLDLFTGLFILIIAPEVYLPLRNVGAQFHAAAQGVSVSSRVLDLIDSETERISYQVGFEPRGLTVLVGPSGAGKSLTLRELSNSGGVWMPQQSTLLPGTLLTNVCFDADVDEDSLNKALDLAQLGGFDLNREVSSESLSGGEIQRIAFARALYRLFTTKQGLLLLDEPTSQLDEPTSQLDALNASMVIRVLRNLVESGIVVVAISHSTQLIEQADQLVRIEH